MSIEVAYQLILSDAVVYANTDARKPMFLAGDFFRTTSSFDKLELWYDPDQFRAAVAAVGADEDSVITDLKAIVQNAIYRAIQDNPDMLGGLILDEIRRRATS